MRVSQQEKDRSHQRIVEGAARLFRKHGIETTSVGDVMTEAGLTHGGFYRHFDTKDALAAAAIQSAFEEIGEAIDAQAKQRTPRAAVAEYFAHYLSDVHVQHPEFGCPAAALGGEVARGSDELKREFGAGFNRVLSTLAKGYAGSECEKREAAIRELALRAGAVMLARASDPETAEAVLAACRRKRRAGPGLAVVG
jgi:TetR/AcrR family transcriptional repressor of nem operon